MPCLPDIWQRKTTVLVWCSPPVVRSNSLTGLCARMWAEAGENPMPHRIVQEVLGKATEDTPPPTPFSRRKRVAAVLRTSWCILRHWRPARSHRPPEMHAIDHLARDHPKAFV